MTPTEREKAAPPCQCSFYHPGYCDKTCPNDREHDPWCSQAGRPVDRSRREANDRIAVALGLNAGIGEPFIIDAIVRKLAAGDYVYDTVSCWFCGSGVKWREGGLSSGATTDAEMYVGQHSADCLYALALAYVEANPA